jgi:DNA-binding NtrC family response regulator
MPKKYNILIVDDDAEMVNLLEEILEKEGYSVTKAFRGKDALQIIKDEIFDMIITDIRMPEIGGLDILRAVKKIHPETIVLLVTAFGTIETAISAMREGAYDYIAKPFRIDEIRILVKRALDQQRLMKEYAYLQAGLKEKYRLENIVGSSNEMLEVYKTVAKVSDSRSTVLITGESGTGKELIARAVHHNSSRADRPFVAIHCAALPEQLIESELFGYVKGAFTGANNAKRGMFEEADTGTCFLDEIGDIPLSTQVKLLRVLQEKEIRRIGAEQTIKVDVRIIAATNANLEKLIAEGKFREDLYYRLSVVSIHLPPLRDRKEDIELLAQHFLRKYSLESGSSPKAIYPGTIELLLKYSWPGNVRELENVLERAVNLAQHELIMPEDLPDKLRVQQPVTPESLLTQKLTMRELEKQYMLQTLQENNWNYTVSADHLGISVRTIQRMIQRYKLNPPGEPLGSQ